MIPISCILLYFASPPDEVNASLLLHLLRDRLVETVVVLPELRPGAFFITAPPPPFGGPASGKSLPPPPQSGLCLPMRVDWGDLRME